MSAALRSPQVARPRALSSSHRSDTDLRPLRVLLADPADAGETAAWLREAASVVGVRGLAELREALARQPIDVVLLDLDLADAWGVDAVRRARALIGDLPLVALAGAADPGLVLACLDAGADELVVRTATNGPLLQRTLRHALGRKRASEIDAWLEHSNRLTELGTLAAGIAHEINNPATVAVMGVGLLGERLAAIGERVDDPETLALIGEAREAQQDLAEAITRIRAVVKNVQSFARPQSQLEELVDVAELCRRAQRITGGEVEARARFRQRLAATGPVLGDARQLEQVVVNLLVNAAHAIPPGDAARHTVMVETYALADAAVISVSDTGCGMTPEVVQRIFEPFFTTKPRERGSGLGLWICSRIVSRMGGQIRVSTEPGRGTRFEVVLPLAERAPEVHVTGDLALRRAEGSVRVVDDEAATAQNL